MADQTQESPRARRYVAPRTCTAVDERKPTRDGGRHVQLERYADAAAYVLIAEPGAGKTTAFQVEAATQGATYVTVRNFLRFDKPEWRGNTLFLDGLDEARAGLGDGRTALDDIVSKLDRLGCPAFRLSCRWRDWLAANDKDGLREISPDATVTVLRLDPLSEQDIKDILAKNHGIEDANSFVAAAKKRGIDRLLSNPQNLKLLAESVARGNWPESRLETFEQACRTLVREPNNEHRAANPSATDTEPLIDAAGRLCAVQLLSGISGYTLPDRAEPDSEYPSLAEIDSDAQGRASQVLGTRLFVGASEGQLTPAHRQIAEFLAARHVSQLLKQGLPLARVTALITGFDAELVPAFHNFVSWLAVHNKASRKPLSHLDASGLAFAGDPETYSAEEKREIVLNLRREWHWNPWCARHLSMSRGFGGIVSPQLERTFREILSDRERGLEHQCYVLLLMEMLVDGEPLPGLSKLLEEIVRDTSWYPNVRCRALDVLTASSEHGSLDSAALEKMVRDIDDGSMDDPQDDLLGVLLRSLYPRVQSMPYVLRYLREPKIKSVPGEYSKFWTDHVVKESQPEQLAELLDWLAVTIKDCKNFMSGEVGTITDMAGLPLESFTQVLTKDRSRFSPDRMYTWLGMLSDSGARLLDGDIAILRFHLQWDQEALRALISHAVETCLANGEDCVDLIDRRLFGTRPFRYGQWCLDMALAAEKPEAAEFYLREAVDCATNESKSDGLTMDSVRARLSASPTLLARFDEMSRGPAGQAASVDGVEPGTPEDTLERPAANAPVGARAANPSTTTLPMDPPVLHRAAEAYFGIPADRANTVPRERLSRVIGSSSVSVDALVAALEATVWRKDLPDCDEVVRLFDERKIDLLVLPFIAGLHSLERSGRLSLADLNEEQIRLAVTILYTLPRHLVDPDSTDGTRIYRPEWFRTLLSDNPALVADVLRRTAARKLESGVQFATELRELWNVQDHREVARLAVLPMLSRFPPANSDTKLQALCWALHAALAAIDWTELGRVVEQRLELGCQEPAERSCWLMTAYFMDPERWRDELRSVESDETGLKWLGIFLAIGRIQGDNLARRIRPADVEPVVAALGAALRMQGLPEKAFHSVSDLIATLRDNPSEEATDAINALEKSPEAKPWIAPITDAAQWQARKRREQEYRHCHIGQVVRTLNNASPANAADLAALVLDNLQELSRRIRDGNTSDWRQYWNVDEYNRPIRPRPENACRDIFLSDLQERLMRLDVEALPEGVYADDKRADIRAGSAGFNVPVEIKRSCHSDLWTAIRHQLVARYTRDPGAAGHGIYLVFWFGDTESCRPTSCSGNVPQRAEELERMLNESLLSRERGLISVCVVDVSAPAKPAP